VSLLCSPTGQPQICGAWAVRTCHS
jgi:hypothetical protein